MDNRRRENIVKTLTLLTVNSPVETKQVLYDSEPFAVLTKLCVCIHSQLVIIQLKYQLMTMIVETFPTALSFKFQTPFDQTRKISTELYLIWLELLQEQKI